MVARISVGGALVVDEAAEIDWALVTTNVPAGGLDTLTNVNTGEVDVDGSGAGVFAVTRQITAGTYNFHFSWTGGNCNCDCNCDCGGCCFLPGARVLRADGRHVAIKDVCVGDSLQGRFGVNEVLGLQRPQLGGRAFVVINRTLFTSADHLVWTRTGWAAVSKHDYLRYDHRRLHTLIERDGGLRQVFYAGVAPADIRVLGVGDEIATPAGFQQVETIDPLHQFDSDLQLYGLRLGGCHTLYVDGVCVSGWATDEDFDYRARIGT